LLTTAFVIGEEDLGEHGFALSGDVKIHYVSKGEGPLVVMLHGFPDYWYSWRHQMPTLAESFHVVAIDQRGYNKSDQPAGVENYAVDKLTSDVKAVIDHFGAEKATIIGHDWGGFVAWSFAMQHPEITDRLVILNLPHPWALQRELATNPVQAKNSQYARNFQMEGAYKLLTAEGLAGWVEDEQARKQYVAAFERSSFEAMLNYYKANYPKPPYQQPTQMPPLVKCPVLMLHGLGDTYLLASGLNETWRWVEKDLTIVTVPDAKHFVQHDRPEFVTATIFNWLKR
jgi:pimeloyl-ACP methyl ester carboxylesterase